MLLLQDIALAEAKVPHLSGITLEFAPGRMTTLLGRTGAGKTTLLRVIAGLTLPDTGRITLNGTDWSRLPPWKRPVAMVTQQFINYPHLSVLDNVAFPLTRAGTPRDEARAVAEAMLTRVGLGAMIGRRPSELSGGQQQRVAIARALVKRAPVLLMDEPFVNLDYKLREGLREDLAELLRKETGTVAIYASTDPREALQMGDHIVLLAEGRALQSGPPRQVFAAPATVAAAAVVNDPPINLLQAEASGGQIRIAALDSPPMPGPDLPPGRYTLGLRAEDVRTGGDLLARVALTEVSGSETVTHLEAGSQSLVMLERAVSIHPLGSHLGLHLDLSRALVFDAKERLVTLEPAHG
ncbi:ABC transporter ATP-binding protein [Neotabrizicola sp. sgz301269]|uniref:ABC transporter ATP-binding protein n=1 Tax=Neotabrizicola sp. sgz301269 TaxID=3276282 RepID=UPI00376F6122